MQKALQHTHGIQIINGKILSIFTFLMECALKENEISELMYLFQAGKHSDGDGDEDYDGTNFVNESTEPNGCESC